MGGKTDLLKLDPIERVSLALSAGSVGAAYVFASPHFATGLAVGAALETMNLRVQVRTARRFFAGGWAGGAGGWLGGFGFRFGLLMIAIIAALEFGADPLGLLVGVSLSMPAVVFWAWRNRPAVMVQAAAPALAADDPSWDRWSVWRAKEIPPEDVDPRSEDAATEPTGHSEGNP